MALRVLGSLIEKESTTPDNYPLTVNALVAACNQTTNRDPVLNLDEAAVVGALDELKRRSLAHEVFRSDSRARRYRHVLAETLSLHPAEMALLCVLMLRGPQTTGEIRTRTARMFEFLDLKHVEVTLQALMTLSAPLVMQLPRQPGQKEVRYAQLLGGEPETPAVPRTRELAAADRAALEQIVRQLEAAWNGGDGAAFGAPFAADADFVNVRAEHVRGRDAIVQGHAAIFQTIYAGSAARLTIESMRLLSGDVALVHVHSELTVPAGPLQGQQSARFSMVLTRRGGDWQIASFHNTLERSP